MATARIVWASLVLTSVLSSVSTVLPHQLLAQTVRDRPSTGEDVTVVDLTSQFLTFYDSASVPGVDPDERWALWERLYDFAAVPPTAFGRDLARQLLDSAWTRYPEALERIREGVNVLDVSPDTALRRVKTVLGCGDDVRVRLTVFVGGFENNAFAYAASDGTPAVAVPVEVGDPYFSVVHEFAHAVHGARAGLPSVYEQSLARLLLGEGVAMRATEFLMPDYPAAYHLSASREWLAAAESRQASILRGIRDHLRDSDEATVRRFTFGSGASGLEREAYFAEWVVSGVLLRRGMSLHDIATTPAVEIATLVDSAIDELLVSSRRTG